MPRRPVAIALVVDELVKSGARRSSAMAGSGNMLDRRPAPRRCSTFGRDHAPHASHLLDQADGALDHETERPAPGRSGSASARIDTCSPPHRSASGWSGAGAWCCGPAE